MFLFQPNRYGRSCEDLLASAPLAPLGPGQPIAEARSRLDALETGQVFEGLRIVDLQMARCCQSAIWLLFGYLDESHEISQEIETPSGSYWHGIMHRRETDFGNAKYWFRRVGSHPVFVDLASSVSEMLAEGEAGGEFSGLQSSKWDPFRFIDLCESAYRGASRLELTCRQIAQIEWQLLFDDCYQKAVGRRD